MKEDKEFFTKEERDNILRMIKQLSGAGFFINDRDEPATKLHMLQELTDRQTFFGKAKLWKVVQGIIETAYLQALVDGRLHFRKKDCSIVVKAEYV